MIKPYREDEGVYILQVIDLTNPKDSIVMTETKQECQSRTNNYRHDTDTLHIIKLEPNEAWKILTPRTDTKRLTESPLWARNQFCLE